MSLLKIRKTSHQNQEMKKAIEASTKEEWYRFHCYLTKSQYKKISDIVHENKYAERGLSLAEIVRRSIEQYRP